MPEPVAWGPFFSLALAGGVVMQFASPGVEVQPRHTPSPVTEEEIDGISQRIVDTGIELWADPRGEQPGRFTTNFGGRGI